jgi:hypothetical protein
MRLKYWNVTVTVVLAVLFCMAGWTMAADPEYSGGQGTEEDPFQIATADDLFALSNASGHWEKYFVQTANIYFTSWDSYGWGPIGSTSTWAFKGFYDGDGHVIDNLFINRSQFFVGLFGYLDGATIMNLGVTNVDVRGDGRVGAIAGVNGGGLIKNCYSTGSIEATGTSIGGLVGTNHGTIENSYSTASVLGDATVGGLVGYNTGTIVKSSSRGSVSGETSIGGSVGYNTGTIKNCYSRGSVTGNDLNVGGFVGVVDNGTIQNCYSTGSVSGTASFLHGFAGFKFDGIITSCFWNVDADNQPDTTSGDDNYGATGKTTAEMRDKETFTEAGWRFSPPSMINYEWKMHATVNDGYPQLEWAYDGPGIISWEEAFDSGGGGCFIGTGR